MVTRYYVAYENPKTGEWYFAARCATMWMAEAVRDAWPKGSNIKRTITEHKGDQ